MSADRWQFWIDVGGTFTDCIAQRPDGTLLRRKVLSSGVTKGVAGAGTTPDEIVDPARQEPEGFWTGYSLRQPGTTIESTIIASHSGRIVAPNTLTAGQGFEIASPADAPRLAIRLFLGLRLDEPIPPCDVRLGTTRGTNALLTRQGAKTGLVATRGHGDFLLIGYQNRPKLFELAIKKPPPLFAAVAEIDERIAADGSILTPLDREQARDELARLYATGIESLAICLLNAYANPAHELALEQIARDVGFREISVSTRVSPLMKLIPRGDTTVVDAYLNPVLRSYVERLAASLPGSELRLMTSAGGLVRASGFTGKDSILSGPAGGVVGCSRVAQAAGFNKAIGFDMGGTSTDVSRFDGRFEYEYETEKAGVRIVAPMLAIETVAAGGGSICRWDGVKLVVGPESAGADPGPACYGRGGPLTITDCNFYLGRLLAEHFPFPLDLTAVERRLAELVEQAASHQSPDQWSGCGASGLGDPKAGEFERQPAMSPRPVVGAWNEPRPLVAAMQTARPLVAAMQRIAEGFVQIANANMAQAIRSISLAKGYDPRDYVLVAFGAAGPQHACAVAAELGIQKILLHPDAGVLSALGMGLADIVKHRTAGVYRPLDEAGFQHAGRLSMQLVQAAIDDMLAESAKTREFHGLPSFDLRYVGTDFALTIPFAPLTDLKAAFEREHRRLFGYVQETRPIEIVAARVRMTCRSPNVLPGSRSSTPSQPAVHGQTLVSLDGVQTAVALYYRNRLESGSVVFGPAVIVEELTTTVIDPGWLGELLSGGELLLTPAERRIESAGSANIAN